MWQAESQGPSEQKPIKYLVGKGAWVYPGTAQIFWVPPIISGMGEATKFKFGWNIHQVYPNKSPLKSVVKGSFGVSRGCPNFLGTPSYLRNGSSYELQILYAYSQHQSEEKPIKNFGKSSPGHSQGL